MVFELLCYNLFGLYRSLCVYMCVTRLATRVDLVWVILPSAHPTLPDVCLQGVVVSAVRTSLTEKTPPYDTSGKWGGR